MEINFEVRREGRRRWRTYLTWGGGWMRIEERAYFPSFSEEAAIRKGMRWAAKVRNKNDWRLTKKRYDADGLEIPKEEWER